MPLIDASYFIGDLQIANLSSQHVRARVDAFIEDNEAEFLSLLFGPLYDDYVAGLNLEDNTIWTALHTSDLKIAFAAYVYFYWMRDKESITTSLGEAKPEAQNSTPTTSINKQVSAWNKMVKKVERIYNYLDINSATYPNWRRDYRNGSYGAKRWERNPLTVYNNSLGIWSKP